jgi:hypothetical protein
MVAINLLDRQSISANHGSETELTDHRLNAGSVSRMRLSCALVTNVESPEVVVEAERLGYRRAWLYDSPALTSDVWVALALAAERTSTIGLGPGVLVPNLRHPMTNAAAIATIAAMAPGRVAIAVGSGFTARYTLGQRPLRWTTVEEYVVALRALLRGETVQLEGASIRMLQTDGFVADRPVDVEVLIGADGPKGTAVAERVGDGVFAAGVPNVAAAGRQHALLQYGTVLDDGEDVRRPGVISSPTRVTWCGSRRWMKRRSRWRRTWCRSSPSAEPRRSCAIASPNMTRSESPSLFISRRAQTLSESSPA